MRSSFRIVCVGDLTVYGTEGVNLLCEARSIVALPDLIERLNDEDRLVQAAVLVQIKRFGPIADEAIPYLEKWIDSSDEYLRIHALTTILRFDPFRSFDVFPEIKAALNSEYPHVRPVAREYFAEMNLPLPFDSEAFKDTVRLHWNYNSPCDQVDWQAELNDGLWHCDMAPVFQEIFGGEDDGKRVWTGFAFEAGDFCKEP